MGGINLTNLLIIAAIVVLLFGTKKLRTLGSDLGASIKGFKKAMNDDDQMAKSEDADFSAKSVEELKVEKTEKPAKKAGRPPKKQA